MAVDVVGVEREEPVDRRVDLAAQAALDALAHHRALLARDGEQVRLDVGQDLLAEGDVQVLARPVGLARDAVAQLEVVDAELVRERARGRVQRGRRAGSVAATPP